MFFLQREMSFRNSGKKEKKVSKTSLVAKRNAEEARNCGKRWKQVVPWHADADEPVDPIEAIDTFAAAHNDVVVNPSEGLASMCPCSAPSTECNDCLCAEDTIVIEDPISVAEAKWL